MEKTIIKNSRNAEGRMVLDTDFNSVTLHYVIPKKDYYYITSNKQSKDLKGIHTLTISYHSSLIDFKDKHLVKTS